MYTIIIIIEACIQNFHPKKGSMIKEHFDALSIKEKRNSRSLLEYV